METIFEWRSPEHRFDKKTADWYWMFGIACIAITTLAFYFGNILFGIFIIIAGITIGTLSYKETKEVEVKITTKGVILGRKLYPWRSYSMFSIDYEHMHESRILLHPISQILPLVVIPISEQVDLEDLRSILREFLEEEYMSESMLHIWFDKLLSI